MGHDQLTLIGRAPSYITLIQSPAYTYHCRDTGPWRGWQRGSACLNRGGHRHGAFDSAREEGEHCRLRIYPPPVPLSKLSMLRIDSDEYYEFSLRENSFEFSTEWGVMADSERRFNGLIRIDVNTR